MFVFPALQRTFASYTLQSDKSVCLFSQSVRNLAIVYISCISLYTFFRALTTIIPDSVLATLMDDETLGLFTWREKDPRRRHMHASVLYTVHSFVPTLTRKVLGD